MIVTILVSNQPIPDNPDLKSRHGLAVHLQLDFGSILYDFGEEGALLHNAQILDINLSAVQWGILSHGNSSYSGGLEAFLELNKQASVYHGRGAFHPKWSLVNGQAQDISVQIALTETIVTRLQSVYSLNDQGRFLIFPAAPGYGPRPTENTSLLTGFEGTRMPDEFTDELTLVVPTGDGLLVITACAHRGILNIIEQVKTYCPNMPITNLISGFHLQSQGEFAVESQDIINRLAKALPEATIRTSHYVENMIIDMFAKAFGNRFESLNVGSRILL